MLGYLLTVFVLVNSAIAGSFPRVRIFNPRAGAIWFTGETRTVVWRKSSMPPPPDPPTVNITLRRNDNAEFRLPIATFVDTNKVTFQWQIPAWLPNADDYRIYILPNRAFPRPGTPNIMASKSKPFTIVKPRPNQDEVMIRSPVPNAVWYGGQNRFIRWSLNSPSPNVKISIFIQDIKNQVVGYPVPFEIANRVPAQTEGGVFGYRWKIPYTFRTSDGYQIKIVAEYDGENKPPVVAIMPGTFTINQVGDAGSKVPVPTDLPQP